MQLHKRHDRKYQCITVEAISAARAAARLAPFASAEAQEIAIKMCDQSRGMRGG